MYSSSSFAPDRQPGHPTAADATGDAGTRAARAARAARAFRPETSDTPPAELLGAPHEVAVPQADGEP